jgi:hypothetical protein
VNTKWIDDLFYFLNKDYGTRITYTQIGKADVDLDTGLRADLKTSIEVSAVRIPISLYQEYLSKITRLGNADAVDRAKVKFLVRKVDLQDLILDTADYFIHESLRYTNLAVEDLMSLYSLSGVATRNAAPYRVLNLSANDNLGLADGV